MSYKGYFIYKGVAYGVGTKVLFTEDVCSKPQYNKENIKKPHTFQWGNTDGYLGFTWCGYDEFYQKQCNDIGIYNPDEEIAKIVEPVYVKLVSWQEKALDNMLDKTFPSDIFGGVLIYLVVMIIGTLFVGRLGIWIFTTIIFICWLLNQHRN